MRHVVRRIARHQRIEIVAADAALHLWKSLAISPRPRARRDRACRGTAQARSAGEFTRARSRGTSPKCKQRAVGQRRIHRQRVVAHGAVAQRTAAAGIVAGHAADGGARGGGDVDRKPQPVLFELAVEVVEHDAGLDHADAVFDVEREDAVQVLGKVDDDPVVDGLAALRGAAAARGDDPALVPGDRKRPQRLVHGPGDHHAQGHDLVERGVGRVAAAVEGVEENVARDLAGETRGKGAVFRRIL